MRQPQLPVVETYAPLFRRTKPRVRELTSMGIVPNIVIKGCISRVDKVEAIRFA